MRISVYAPTRLDEWRAELAAALPDAEVVAWSAQNAVTRADYLVARAPPPGMFASLTGLKAVFLLTAGADGVLSDPDRPGVPIYRLQDGGMRAKMVEYCLYGVLRFHRRFDIFEREQTIGRWSPAPSPAAGDRRVGVLGLGGMGRALALRLAAFDFQVLGWSRSQHSLPGVSCYFGPRGLLDVAARSDILVNLLPLTPETVGVLDAELLAAMPHGSALVSAGRGEHLDEDALIAAIEGGRLRGALLDVLADEPPASDAPIWTHPRVKVTPHVAAWSEVAVAAREVAASITAVAAGEDLPGRVDESLGY